MNGMQMAAAPHDPIGWTIAIVGAIVTVWTIVISIYWMIRPGENDPHHPKNAILRSDR